MGMGVNLAEDTLHRSSHVLLRTIDTMMLINALPLHFCRLQMYDIFFVPRLHTMAKLMVPRDTEEFDLNTTEVIV